MNDELNQPGAPEPQVEETHDPVVSSEEKQWLLALHFSALSGLLIPLGSIIAPLVIWLIKKDEMAVLNEHGKAVLNFQITVGIAGVVCFILVFLVIGLLILPVLVVFWLVMTIIGGVRAADGKLQNFYLSIPLIR